MRVTRFVNGEKTEKEEMSKILVQNELISGTIETVNRRLRGQSSSLRGENKTING